MKKYIIGLIFLAGSFSWVFAQNSSTQIPVSHHVKAGGTMEQNNRIATVKMSFDNEVVIVEMFDNPASREFLAMLPLTLDFCDFANAEKIAYLPEKLNTKGSLGSEVKGDFAYYAPWGNLAIFYKGYGTASGLYIMGHIVSGKDRIAQMKKPFTAKIKKEE